jgi:hypothetical protein
MGRYLLDASGFDTHTHTHIYIYVCFDWFSKFLKLYSLKVATTKPCQNKNLIRRNYAVNVTRSTCTLSRSSTQFDGRFWKNKLADMNTDVLFSTTRNPQANPKEGYIKQIDKFCAIYCHKAHKDG